MRCWPSIGLMFPSGRTFTMSQASMFPTGSGSSQGDSHARTTRLQEHAEDWLGTVARSGGSSIGSLLSAAPPGLSERMFLGSCQAEEALTSGSSSTVSPTLGMASSGLCWIANGSEWRNDAAACSLSDILVESPDPKYSLSARACSGILRRAEKRERSLPQLLLAALSAVAARTTTGHKQDS